MRRLLFVVSLLALAGARPPDIPFEKHTLDLGASEACTLADVNGDGRLDIVSGENWFEAPKWVRHKFRELNFANNYVDDFSDLALDVDGDGRVDIVSCAWYSRKLSWWRNPGPGPAQWKEQDIDTGFPIEFCLLADLDNDGKAREVLPQFGPPKAPLAWYEPRNGAFVKHVIAPASQGHGIGAGDVNGDRRTDIITPKGWYEAPADPRSGNWTFHADFDLGATGFIYALDVNGDGRKDLLTSLAHDYGIFWMERMPDGKWVRRLIDDSWSQPHALTPVDLRGGGRLAFITGKRYMAHNGKDPGEREPLGVYWYEPIPGTGPKGGLEWVRHLVDYSARAGGGMQIAAGDLDGDGDLDFVTPGKSGLFLFENLSKKKTK